MKIKNGYMLRKVDGTSIVVAAGEESTKFNGMIKLNSTGTFLWKLLSSEKKYDELLIKMIAAYDVDDKTAIKEIDAFVAKLNENGLILDE